MILRYSEQSIRDLKKFEHNDRQLTVKKLEYLEKNFETLKNSKKITQLKGSKFKDQYRYIVARKIRVLFRLEDDKIVILILRVGLRKEIYR